MQNRGLWIAFGLVLILSFAILGYFGAQIYHQAPPIPKRVMTTQGQVLFTAREIQEGQNVWQSMGGQEMGSVWGHGAYVAPDWSADWLHRELVWMLDQWAVERHDRPYQALPPPDQAALKARLVQEIRPNSYDPSTGDLTISVDRAAAVSAVGAHYDALFGSDLTLASLRQAYAIPANAVPDPERRRSLTAFFFWTSWACSTDRPGKEITYTSNWPAEPLIDNRPTEPIILWSIVSVIGLLAGVGALIWFLGSQSYGAREEDPSKIAPAKDPLLSLQPTPSMRATLKYFWTVTGLIVVQVLLGVVSAHYGVEGNGFYGIPLAKWLPYTVARTWHVQLGIFWIATAWLATGLFVAPAVSGHEPKGQRFGVNLLFGALLLIVVGSLAGEWLGAMQKLGLQTNFWFGHMGYEYVDLGRVWQILLLAGLVIWLGLVWRALRPAFRKPQEGRQLLSLFVIAAGAIGLFYSAGLMWGRHTNLAIAEYWRWWVVHLWVEGFFEVFATVVVAFLFTRMGLLRIATATTAVLLSSVIYLSGGIIGTMHHLYFTGTPTGVLAFGAVFSALEVVPLVMVGFEAYRNMSLARVRDWLAQYRWAIYFFVAVAFWNLVGAGLFGFLINPPIALYYMQGLNTTPVHGHTALFGVYGMLGIGLMLFCLRGMDVRSLWKTKFLAVSFWMANVGLMLMVLLSLLPVGLLQTKASIEHGFWFARSAEFLQQPLIQTLRWMRVIGDTVFTIGMLALGWFILGLKTGWSIGGEARAEGAPSALNPLTARQPR